MATRNRFLWETGCVDMGTRLCFDARVKLLLLFCALAAVATSCTTLANRRDLYNPSEDAGPYNSLKPRSNVATGNPAQREEPLPPSQ